MTSPFAREVRPRFPVRQCDRSSGHRIELACTTRTGGTIRSYMVLHLVAEQPGKFAFSKVLIKRSLDALVCGETQRYIPQHFRHRLSESWRLATGCRFGDGGMKRIINVWQQLGHCTCRSIKIRGLRRRRQLSFKSSTRGCAASSLRPSKPLASCMGQSVRRSREFLTHRPLQYARRTQRTSINGKSQTSRHH